MTARTLTYLDNTLLAPAQAAGSITPLRMQDLVDTMNIRTGGSLAPGIVRVTDPEFGADPTGVADSTAAFQNAMAAGIAYVPGLQANGSIAVYTLNNCLVPNGASIIGFSPMGFASGANATIAFTRPRIIPAAGAARVFNVDTTAGALFQGLNIDCSSTNNTTDAISAGGRTLTIRDCAIHGARYGLGGQVSTTESTAGRYSNATFYLGCYNTQFEFCVAGIYNLEDGFIHGSDFMGCGNGFLADAQSNVVGGNFGNGLVALTGVRFEYCGLVGNPGIAAGQDGHGINISGSGTINIANCQFDNCGGAGVFFGPSSFGCTLISSIFTRNGANVTSGTTLKTTSAHVRFNGAFNILLHGNLSQITNANDNTNAFSPARFAYFDGTASNNGGIVFIGNDVSGCQGSTAGATRVGPINSATAWRAGTVPTGSGLNAYVVSKNLGTGAAASDIDTR